MIVKLFFHGFNDLDLCFLTKNKTIMMLIIIHVFYNSLNIYCITTFFFSYYIESPHCGSAKLIAWITFPGGETKSQKEHETFSRAHG